MLCVFATQHRQPQKVKLGYEINAHAHIRRKGDRKNSVCGKMQSESSCIVVGSSKTWNRNARCNGLNSRYMRVLYSISVFCCIVSVYGWESVCMFVCAMKILSFYCTRCACSSINAFLMFVCVWAFHLCIFVYKTCIHPCQFCEYRPRDIHSHALTHVHNHSHKHGEAHNVPHTRLAVPLLLLLLCHFYVSPFLPPTPHRIHFV